MGHTPVNVVNVNRMFEPDRYILVEWLEYNEVKSKRFEFNQEKEAFEFALKQFNFVAM